MSLALYNTLSRSKEPFTPLDAERVTMYVCGPTVYNRVHIGNARPAVVFDTLYRLLMSLYPNVQYARNITDIDDKIMKTAAELGEDISVLSTRYAEAYFDDMQALNNLPPTIVPYATQHIPEMIDMISRLVAKAHAYESEGHVLFAVQSMADYGKLSGRSLDDMLAGARVEVASYKKYAGDFILWKPSADDEPGWDSPWGRGRPGWHLECSAMIEKHLGDSIDIHGGGQDLIFPHHENEIAQVEAATEKTFARHWFHIAHLMVEGKKMSKSLGNLHTLEELDQKGYLAQEVRYVLLSGSYRQPLNFTFDSMNAARKALSKLSDFATRFEFKPASGEKLEVEFGPFYPVQEALLNDLNTPEALGRCFRLIRELNEAFERGEWEGKKDELNSLRKGFQATCDALGLIIQPKSDQKIEVPSEIEAIAQRRWDAKQSKEWSIADQLRDELLAEGWIVKDGKDGFELAKA